MEPHGCLAPLPLAVPQLGDGAARGQLPLGVVRGHRRRLPPAGRLHFNEAGAGRRERLRGAHPWAMPGHTAALDTSIASARPDDFARCGGGDRPGLRMPTSAHAAEQRAVMHPARFLPVAQHVHGGRADVQHRAARFLIGF